MGGIEIGHGRRTETYASPTSHNNTQTPDGRLFATVLFAGSNHWAGDDAVYKCTGTVSSTRGRYVGANGIP
jgi:hypothetical protein